MTDRDTASTPHELSSDGACYFRYPDGDAPVVTVADYAALRTKGSADAWDGRISVTDQYLAGSFSWSASDPYSAGDDGGLVIEATDGWWVRSHQYGADHPIDLGWYESVTDEADITALLLSIAEIRSPVFSIRVPAYPCTLLWNEATTVDFTTTYSIYEFCIYESNAPVTIHIMSPEMVAAWSFTGEFFRIGATVKKEADYLLSFLGTWTWDNRPVVDYPDSSIYASGHTALIMSSAASIARQSHLRCNAAKFVSDFVLFNTDANTTLSIAGKYTYGAGLRVDVKGHVIYESCYVSDEVGRKCGWTGESDGLLIRNGWSHVRTGGAGGVVTGATSGTAKISGEIIHQYGGASNYFFWDIVGNSINDPLVLIQKDFGITGPNDLGKPAGVSMMQHASYYNHYHKSDGFGPVSKDIPDLRFFKLITSYDDGEQLGPESWKSCFFIENAQGDDVSGAGATYTTEVTFILVNVRGLIWQQNGTLPGDRIDTLHFMGDGINPAMIAPAGISSNPTLVVALKSSVQYGQFVNLELWDIDGIIDTVTVTGKIIVNGSVNGWSVSDVTFLGSARNIIEFRYHASLSQNATFDVNNIHAPVGSTITNASGAAGTFLLNGVQKTLPYTLQAGDIGTPVQAIPANPLLSAS